MGNGVLRSGPVAPGLCHISVFGKGVGAQLVPVQVRAGEEAKAVVSVQAGHLQTFRFSAPRKPSERHVRIMRGKTVVADVTYRARVDWALPPKWERWLAAGDYVVTVTGDGLSGRARFSVGAGRNEDVRVALK